MRPWRSCKKFGTSHPLCERRRPMDENLIGYLLDALDSDTRLETEKYLSRNSDARLRLEKLRQALEPLEADNQADEPPPDLWIRTLARVAEYRCNHLPFAPASSS